jgi:NAD(P)-dependent dehydrogenase (short-subunit alcohol dehydrogenase family)
VVINYHCGEIKAREVAFEVEKMGRKRLTIHADVGSNEDVNAMIEEATAVFDRIDILVNNAGLLIKGEFIVRCFWHPGEGIYHGLYVESQRRPGSGLLSAPAY